MIITVNISYSLDISLDKFLPPPVIVYDESCEVKPVSSDIR